VSKNPRINLQHVITFIIFFCIGPLLFANSAKEAGWALHDVSILFPLPDNSRWDSLISPSSQENLLPLSVLQKIPYLINQPNEVTHPTMRVVGIRVDPCFSEGHGPITCQKQVRFVWQPLMIKNNKTTTVDASLHAFFVLTDNEFSVLLRQLADLNDKYKRQVKFFNPSLPLGVHPILKEVGLNSNYAQQLRSIFLNAVKDKPMSRITFMKLKGMDDMWFFGGFDFTQDTATAIQIPNLTGATEQEFINEMAIRPPAKQFLGGIFPAADEESPFSTISKDSGNLEEYTDEQIKKMIREVADFDNPKKHNPGTLDCVSCHLAGAMRTWANINFAPFALPAEYESYRYKNSNYNLTNNNELPGQTNVLRLFGYFDDKPITAQRVINESAEAASAIANFGQKK